MATFTDEAGTLESGVPYQLSDASRPALTRYRAFVGSDDRPNRVRISTRSGAKRRLKPTMILSFPVSSTVARMRSSSSARESQRLFDEDRFSRFEGAAGQVGMRAVPGDDEDGVDRLVLEDGVRVRAGNPKSEFALRIDG